MYTPTPSSSRLRICGGGGGEDPLVTAGIESMYYIYLYLTNYSLQLASSTHFCLV
jgi:hypothetical protein